LYVSTDAQFDIPVSYEITGDAAKWVTIEPDMNSPNSTVYISNTHYLPVKVIIQPPADVAAGTYTGNIRLLTGTINKPSGTYGSQFQAAFMIRLTVKVTGTEFLSCSAGGVTIRDSEVGKPIEYYMTVADTGNIRIKPNITIDVWNQDQTKLMFSHDLLFNGLEILPTTSRALMNTFNADLRVGQYWGYVTIYPCQNSELVTFNIYEPGTIVDSGEFVRLENQAWAKIGDVVPINAVFKNTGQRVVSAKLKGVVTLDNKIVDTIDSEYYDVVPDNTTAIKVYFTPKKLGQYMITARILYNNKLSYEKSSVLNVNEGTEAFNWLYVLIIIVIIIIVLLLLINIKRKRHKIHRL
jgi:hypothetical protein